VSVSPSVAATPARARGRWRRSRASRSAPAGRRRAPGRGAAAGGPAGRRPGRCTSGRRADGEQADRGGRAPGRDRRVGEGAVGGEQLLDVVGQLVLQRPAVVQHQLVTAQPSREVAGVAAGTDPHVVDGQQPARHQPAVSASAWPGRGPTASTGVPAAAALSSADSSSVPVRSGARTSTASQPPPSPTSPSSTAMPARAR
jgi:hypothetical protein